MGLGTGTEGRNLIFHENFNKLNKINEILAKHWQSITLENAGILQINL